MDMEAGEYCRQIDELNTYGIDGLWLYHLGESILHPQFPEILDHVCAKSNLGEVWLSTNGQAFDDGLADMVMQSDIDYLNFSMNAVTEATYRTVSNGDFHRVQNNLEYLYMVHERGNKPILRAQMIEQTSTQHEVDLFIEAHIDRADIVSVNQLEYAGLKGNKDGMELRTRPPLTTCTRVSRGDCFIMSDGDVTLCDAAFNGEILLGNIHKKKLYDIWNGPERKAILALNQIGEMWRMPFCRGCTDYDL
jgi:radical SAM protein with 4Fe4S-binding SPASM domain